jgi:hypothetical protein
MDNFFKREEKTASEKQVKASVRTMLGIMEHRKEIELPTDKKQLKIVLENSISYFNEWLQGNHETWTSGNTSEILSMSDYSRFDKCYRYLPDADVQQGIKECLIAAVTEQAFEAEEEPKAKTKAQVTAAKRKAAKASKADKAAMTIQAKEKPVDAKPVSWKPVIDDDMLELAAKEGLSESGLAMLLHAAAKANS